MPLLLHGVWDSWGIVFDPIPFVCTDGTKKIRCWASLDALAKLAGLPTLESFDDPELANLFAGWVDHFAQLASTKFDGGQLQPDGSVIITARDVSFAAARRAEAPRSVRTAATKR